MEELYKLRESIVTFCTLFLPIAVSTFHGRTFKLAAYREKPEKM
jgi:hypothetical protein